MRKIATLILFLLLIPARTLALDLKLELSTDKDIVYEGDEIILNFNFSYPGNQRIDLSEIPIPGIDNFQILSSSKSQNTQIVNSDIATSSSLEYGLRPLGTGEFQIGPVEIAIRQNSGEPQKFISNKKLIEVRKSYEVVHKTELTGSINFSNNIIVYPLSLLIPLIVSYLSIRYFRLKKEKEAVRERMKRELEDSKKTSMPEIKDKNFILKSKEYLQDQIKSENNNDRKNELKIILEEIESQEYTEHKMTKKEIYKLIKSI